MLRRKHLSNLAKARGGFTLAGLAVWAIIAYQLGRHTEFMAAHGFWLALFLAICGFLVISIDRRPRPASDDAGAPPAEEETTDDSPDQRLLEPRHWGRTLIAAAIILLGTTLLHRKPATVKAPPVAPAPVAPVQVEIPPITLQGVTVSQGKPTALIDNGTYQIGDVIHGLRIVAITARSVTVTYEGTTNVLQLGVNRFQISTAPDRLP